MAALWCELAWLGGEQPAARVRVEVDGDGRIASVTAGADPGDAERLPGLTIPGLANAHSHAFQRALRGRAQGRGSFWTWREEMLALAEALDPDAYLALARATFAEMALAGVTLVGEFHYLHHGPGGVPYDDPNEMGRAMLAAATEAGIRIVLLDACYLHGGSARFRDPSAAAWAERVAGLGGADAGAAIHSVRAVDPGEAAVVAEWAARRGAPLHAHVSEQPAENAFALEAHGLTPTALLCDAGALSERFTAIHATHVTHGDGALLGEAGATVCLCPTTERDLADGIGPARALAGAGARLALGSDSQAVIDLLEEARAVELDERLASGERGRHGTAELLTAATAGGYASLGLDGGRIAPGAPADLTTVALDSARLAGTPPLDGLVFCAGAADVRDVMVGGRWIVRDGAHLAIDVPGALREALAS